MLLSPEIIAEQVMGYVVGAAEMIPTLKSAAKNTYTTAIIPQGPHFYTGLLQAAGYLLINNKNKLCIISQQSDDAKAILIDTNRYEPIFGQTRKNKAAVIAKIKTSIGGKYSTDADRQVADNLMLQLPFIRIIQEAKELVHLSIGEKISSLTTKKITTWIQNHAHEYTMVFLANIEISGVSRTSKKNNEENEISKSIQNGSSSSLLIQIFQSLLSKQKKQPEIIAYVKPQNGEKSSKTTRYICAVG